MSLLVNNTINATINSTINSTFNSTSQQSVPPPSFSSFIILICRFFLINEPLLLINSLRPALATGINSFDGVVEA